jgi:hypothetical protein
MKPERSDRLLPVAAIHHEGQADLDTPLAAFAQAQRAKGRLVLGLVMQARNQDEACLADMVLIDIDNGEPYKVSQSLGSQSNACRADPHGFALASRVLRDAKERKPDLVICNRFGGLEATGGGFSAELLALLADGVPVLTVVATRHLAAWQKFVGESQLLGADPGGWAQWFDAVMAPDPTETKQV